MMSEIKTEETARSEMAHEAGSKQGSTTLLLASDACCHAGHNVAEVERGGGEAPVLVCVTCTELWGRMEGLRSWQEHCPCCFSEAHPHGLADLGISAQPLSDHH